MAKFAKRHAVILFADGKLDWIAVEDTDDAARTTALEWAKNNPDAGMVMILPVETVFESFLE
jgi:hypothetical protein